jgi:hypothetical protein
MSVAEFPKWVAVHASWIVQDMTHGNPRTSVPRWPGWFPARNGVFHVLVHNQEEEKLATEGVHPVDGHIVPMPPVVEHVEHDEEKPVKKHHLFPFHFGKE